MKTRANHFFKIAFMAVLVSTLFVSCGKNNSSGGGSNTVTPNPYGTYPGSTYAGVGQLPSNFIQIIEQENPCRTGVGGVPANAARISAVIPLQGANVNAGGVFVGVTPEGDVGIITNQAQGPVMEIRLCPRPDLTGNGQLVSNPVLNTSQMCPVGEITAATISLASSSGMGNYTLPFAPIHILGTDRFSTLCRR